MRILDSKLRKLPVVTELGAALGHVADLELDAESHAVIGYIVHGGIKFFGAALRITPAEVISITAERMTVKDTVIPIRERLAAADAAPAV